VVNVYGVVVFFKQPYKTRGTGESAREQRLSQEQRTWNSLQVEHNIIIYSSNLKGYPFSFF
jgi:hypothetical protein